MRSWSSELPRFGSTVYIVKYILEKTGGCEKLKKVRSGVGIALAVILITFGFVALTASTIAKPDTPESGPGGEHFLYSKHHELQNRSAEISARVEAMKLIEGQAVTELNIAIPDLSESQSRGEHLASTKKRELQSRPSFEDLMGVTDMEKQIEYRKELQSERMAMRDKSEEPQPIVTFVHSSTGNEVTKFSSSFNIAPREESEMMMQGSGSLNLSGNYSKLWHQSLEANNTYAEIIPDIDGDNNPDVLVGTIKYNPVMDVETVTVIAKKGTNGTHLWEQSVSASGRENCDIAVYPLDDLDGDGLDDFIVTEWFYNESTGIATVTKIAKKGTNGTHLWEESVSGTEFFIGVYWGDDLDGDGLGDFIFQKWIRDSVTYTQTAEVIAKRGYDGTHLWKQTVSGEACYMYVNRILDLDGDGLEDVIVNV
jgi:hypothetical protein